MEKLTATEKHLLILAAKGADDNGHAPVSKSMLGLVRTVPSELLDLKIGKDGNAYAKLTDLGNNVVASMAWLDGIETPAIRMKLPEPWVSTGILTSDASLPDAETPVEILFYDGTVRIGELCWERPGHEDTFTAYQYWDDVHDDGQNWDWTDIVAWRPIPPLPEFLKEKLDRDAERGLAAEATAEIEAELAVESIEPRKPTIRPR